MWLRCKLCQAGMQTSNNTSRHSNDTTRQLQTRQPPTPVALSSLALVCSQVRADKGNVGTPNLQTDAHTTLVHTHTAAATAAATHTAPLHILYSTTSMCKQLQPH